MQKQFKIVFVVYIEGALVGVVNEQCSYIILDKLRAYPKFVADRSSQLDQRALHI
jgi:hypothetical protein